ncbi:hypothetical protein HY492_00840 [Candidatus Woesearchaeota archaeon]|nr:hypothetical protein [Candidatus Woesearchaeota archaeon]
MLKLDLSPYGTSDPISYAFNDDRFIRGVREQYAFRWSPVHVELVLLGSVPVSGTLEGFTEQLRQDFFPVIGEEQRLYTVNRKILEVGTLGRMRFF